MKIQRQKLRHSHNMRRPRFSLFRSSIDVCMLVRDCDSMGENKCQRIQIESKAIPGYCGEMGWAWLKDFAAAVNEKRSPLVTPDDILKAIKVVDAFYKSIKSGTTESIQE